MCFLFVRILSLILIDLRFFPCCVYQCLLLLSMSKYLVVCLCDSVYPFTLSIDIWIVSMFWLLQVKLLRTYPCGSSCVHAFSFLGKYVRVEWLGYMFDVW